MLRLAVEDDPSLAIDGCEIERANLLYDLHTIKELYSRYRIEGKPGLLIGDDLVPGFPSCACRRSWRKRPTSSARADRASRSYPFHSRHRYAHNSIVQVSSSMVRERIAAGKPFRRLVAPPSIAASSRTGFMDCAELLRRVGIAASTLSSREIARPLEEVAELAASLCAREGIDPDRGRAAALAHDMCKEMPKKAQRELAALYPDAGVGSALMADKVVHGPRRPPSSRATMALADEGILEAEPAYRGQGPVWAGSPRYSTARTNSSRARAPRRRRFRQSRHLTAGNAPSSRRSRPRLEFVRSSRDRGEPAHTGLPTLCWATASRIPSSGEAIVARRGGRPPRGRERLCRP